MICASGAGRSMTTECTTVPACRCLARRRSAVLDPPAAGLIPTRSAQQLLRGHRPAAERVTGGCHGRAVRPPVLATQRSATTRSADVPCLERPPWRIGVGVDSPAPKRAAVARSACQRRAISGIIPTATIPLTFSGCLTPRRVSGESRLAIRSGAWNLPAHQVGARSAIDARGRGWPRRASRPLRRAHRLARGWHGRNRHPGSRSERWFVRRYSPGPGPATRESAPLFPG